MIHKRRDGRVLSNMNSLIQAKVAEYWQKLTQEQLGLLKTTGAIVEARYVCKVNQEETYSYPLGLAKNQVPHPIAGYGVYVRVDGLLHWLFDIESRAMADNVATFFRRNRQTLR